MSSVLTFRALYLPKDMNLSGVEVQSEFSILFKGEGNKRFQAIWRYILSNKKGSPLQSIPWTRLRVAICKDNRMARQGKGL